MFIVSAVVLVACGAERDRQSTKTSRSEQPASDRAQKKKKAGSAKPRPSEFAFVVTGDSRGRDGGVHRYGLTKTLAHVMEQGRAKLVLFTGDMVGGGTTTDRLAAQLRNWNTLVQPYRDEGLEILVTAGNHEIDDGTLFEFEPGRLGKPTKGATANQKAVAAAFPKLPKNGPGKGGLTYWVRRGTTLIVVLDSYRPGYFNTVDTSWLEKTLSTSATNPPPSHVFVATHAPAFPVGGHELDSLPNYNLDRGALKAAGVSTWPWQPGSGGPRDVDVDWTGKRDTFWKVLVDHKVTAFFAGHEHNLAFQKVDGVWQVISGALTKRLYPENTTPRAMYNGKPQNPRAGDTIWHGGNKTWGYVLVSVQGEKVMAEVWGWTDDDDTVRLIKEIALR